MVPRPPAPRLAALFILLAIAGGAGAPAFAQSFAQSAAQPISAPTPCESAGTAAEQGHGIPPGLLNAIGRIESGRRDPRSGRLAAWPWAINAEGRGKLFDSRDDALAGTRALQASGVASIDVGCFQVNLVHHRTAFATLEDAFDPARNADYAARFLAGLRDRTGSWDQAVASYHSATPERGLPYRDRVMASWGPPGNQVPAQMPAAPIPAAPAMVRMVSWSPQASGPMRVWTPSAPGQGASVIQMAARPPRF